MSYYDFLRSKVIIAPESGIEIDLEEIHPDLKPHQRDAVRWALAGGRRGLFERFGLGKTAQELEFCRLAVKHAGGKALIVLPLGVRQEFQRDAVELLGLRAPQYVRTMAEAAAADSVLLLTNYERVRDGDIDPTAFTACCLDEASVLRSFGSKTYQTFLDKFKGVRFKLVATATPSPNRYKELIHYAGFLEVSDTGQALTRFFQRDSTKAGNLTLYPHKENEFWLWVSTWGLFLSKPSDLGYSDEGYALPPLEVRTHIIHDDYGKSENRDGQIKFTNDAAISLTEAAREKKTSITRRIQKAKEIVDSEPEEHFILWHDLEAERHEIKRVIPEAVDIYGSMDYDERERRVIDFSEGRTRIFATKKELSGSGCNFQRHCRRAIFVGIDYDFNDFIQAIHRIYRFLQKGQVVIDIIYTESEQEIYRVLMEKWRRHDELEEKMGEIIRKYGLTRDAAKQMERSIGVSRMEVKGNRFTVVNNDCVEETTRMKENSIDLIHTSIPFSNHYEYTPSYNDFGHNENTARFFEQMDYLTPQLLRILKPGRVAAIHVKDRVLFGSVTGMGMPTIEPFHAMCIQHYTKHGFAYFGMITVTTDVVRENNQTYRLGYSEQCLDGTKMGVGCPEYILLFRKLQSDRTKAYADEPVKKSKSEYSLGRWQLDAHAFWRSSGDRLLKPEELARMNQSELQRRFKVFCREHIYDYEAHVKMQDDLGNKLPKTFMAIPPTSNCEEVWDDVNRMKTLNTTQSHRRQQLHVCPLQFDIADRVINRFSNPGDLVLDPFGGLGTVALEAMKLGRRGYSIELNPDYFRDAVAYLKAEDEKEDVPTLFDLLEAQ